MMEEEQDLARIRDEIAALVGRFADIRYQPRDFIPGETYIPPSGKLLDGAELKLMVEASLDGWLTTGRFNEAFEKSLAQFLGIRSVLTVNSGSSANLVAFMALTSEKLGDRAIRPGDEVITVAAGFPTTVNPILQAGAVPVFVDIEIPTYNIDVTQIEAAIGPRTKAIMLAHTLGNPFDLDLIRGLCDRHQLWLVEDCCDALGSRYQGRLVGTFGDIGSLSFYPAHHITMGEGGAVFTHHPRLRQIAESIRDWGRDCFCPPGRDDSCGKRFGWQLGQLPFGYDHKYTYSHLGYNLKISDMQAACGVAQLEKLGRFIDRRRQNFDFLSGALLDLEDSLILPRATEGSEPSWFGFPITLKPGVAIERHQLMAALEQRKVGSRLLFAGNLTRQPYMASRAFRVSGSLTNTDTAMQRTFWVGVQPALSQEMLAYLAETLKRLIRREV